jgi:hypothetical protein
MSELPFFKTLHEETKPVGRFGRGTHYSVMRAPIWQDKWLNPLPQGAMLDFAIIWDEDHDERVLEIIERLYFAGLLAPVRFIGERKGTLSVLIDAETAEAWKPLALRNYREAVSDISNSQADSWPAYISSLATLRNTPERTVSLDPSIIHEDRAKVVAYLQNIDMLWHVGIKPHKLQVELPDHEHEAYLARLSTPSIRSTTDDSESDEIPF